LSCLVRLLNRERPVFPNKLSDIMVTSNGGGLYAASKCDMITYILSRKGVLSVRLLDLQLLYGVAGAREHFERLCTLLIKSEFASAKEVRCDPGDGGVDVYVGQWDDPEGIAVFQVKYFLPYWIERESKRANTCLLSSMY